LCKLLCEAGADPNYKRFSHDHPDHVPDFPLWVALRRPATISVLLSFGADPSLKHTSSWDATGRHCASSAGNDLVTPEEEAVNYHAQESVRILAEARLLRPRLRAMFALRALCNRGRAAPTLATPFLFVRLVGGSAQTLLLPDPLAHLVCKFWLGSPPRRVKKPALGALDARATVTTK